LDAGIQSGVSRYLGLAHNNVIPLRNIGQGNFQMALSRGHILVAHSESEVPAVEDEAAGLEEVDLSGTSGASGAREGRLFDGKRGILLEGVLSGESRQEEESWGEPHCFDRTVTLLKGTTNSIQGLQGLA
jgi:hypothetical protein